MFEEYGFKGVYISIQAVLTLYAQGNYMNVYYTYTFMIMLPVT